MESRTYIDEDGNTVVKPQFLEVNGYYNPWAFRSIRDFHSKYPNPIDRFFYYIRIEEPYIAHQYIEQIRYDIDRQVANIIFKYVIDIPSDRRIPHDYSLPGNIDTGYGLLKIDELILMKCIKYNIPNVFIKLFPTVVMTDKLYDDIYNEIVSKIREHRAPDEIISYLARKYWEFSGLQNDIEDEMQKEMEDQEREYFLRIK